MAWFLGQSDQKGDGGELTLAEELFVANLESLSYQTGDLLFYNGFDLDRFGIGNAGQVLTVVNGEPAWANPSISGPAPDLTPYLNKDGSVALTADWNAGAFNITAASFIIPAGTSSQFLKADGSLDDSTYLTSDTDLFVGVGATPKNLKPANPTSTTSVSYVMAGLGADATQPLTFTPLRTNSDGKSWVRITIQANGTGAGSPSATGSCQMAYGTGNAPANGAAATGTVTSNAKAIGNNATTGTLYELFYNVIITDLTPNTAYWFDCQFKKVTGTSVSIVNIQVTIQEI